MWLSFDDPLTDAVSLAVYTTDTLCRIAYAQAPDDAPSSLRDYVLEPLQQTFPSIGVMQSAIGLLEDALQHNSAVEVMDTFYKWMHEKAQTLLGKNVVFYYTSSLQTMPAAMKTVRCLLESFPLFPRIPSSTYKFIKLTHF